MIRQRAVEAGENVLGLRRDLGELGRAAQSSRAKLQTFDGGYFDFRIKANEEPVATADKKTLSMAVLCSLKVHLALLER
ncbi:hypothetical protein EDS67_20315 [candidate division KSB1 bacterium]|nr:MAG: hypothetical protein EDS67_20315 [candidate division KSB1 bacterium]MBC6951070.1 hypothetical protein [candidate division KSB1 bacterium]MCE7943698.1 hypothetical protein [Chlorobi bacterium CHB1]